MLSQISEVPGTHTSATAATAAAAAAEEAEPSLHPSRPHPLPDPGVVTQSAWRLLTQLATSAPAGSSSCPACMCTAADLQVLQEALGAADAPASGEQH